MKPTSTNLASLLFSFAFASFATAADVTVQLSNVHLCCDSCVKGVDKAVATVAGATAVSDQDAKTVTVTAADQAAAQQAVNALTAAGYFGVSNNPAIKVDATTGATDASVQSLTVSDVHLCCKKCVTAVNKALDKVAGVKANTAAKDAKSFEVTGDFKPTEVFSALQEAGLTGKAGKAP
jgi:periplasmic mercuric ion binding protein